MFHDGVSKIFAYDFATVLFFDVTMSTMFLRGDDIWMMEDSQYFDLFLYITLYLDIVIEFLVINLDSELLISIENIPR